MSGTFLGIDVGTSLIKLALIDETANCLAEVERPLATHMPRSGVAEQDGAAIVATVAELMSELSGRLPDAIRRLAAISASGQSAGAIAVDRDGKPLTPWYPSALDTRFRPQLDALRQRLGPRLFRANAAWPYTVPRLLWWRETGVADWSRIASVPSLAGFVLGSLADDPLPAMAMDASALTWYGAADLQRRRWDDELVELIGLDRRHLPPIEPSGTVVGRLSSAVAAATGLPAGVPLIVGLGDTVASLVGANVLDPGDVLSVNGSFTNYLVCLDRCLNDAAHEMVQPLASPLPDVWYALLYIGGGGFVHRQMAESLAGVADADAYARLDAEAAAEPPGCGGLTFLPYSLGRFCPPEPGARGGFHGLAMGHGRGALWRAVVEGLTYDLIDMVDIVKEQIPGWRPKRIRITGGGGNSRLWCRIQADMLGVPGERYLAAPSAPVGAALHAGVAVGAWPDLRSAASLIRLEAESIPFDAEATATYADAARRRRRLIEALQPVWAETAAAGD